MSFFLFDKNADKDRVPNRTLFGYAAGLAGQNVTYNFISGWLNYFCINLLHIPSRTVGRLFFASYFWDAVNDPLIGSFIDSRRHKNGEKLRPYLKRMPPVVGLLSAMLFFNIGLSKNGIIVYILAIYFMWDFFYSVQDVALWGMIAVSSPLSDERARAAQWASIGAGAGGAIIGSFQMLRSLLLGAGIGDMTIFVVCGILFGLGGELVSMSAHSLKESVKTETVKENIFRSLTLLRYNPTLLLIVGARLASSLTPKLSNTYFFENMTSYRVGGRLIDGKMADFLVGTLSGIPGALAIFFATKIAEKLGGMKRLLVVSQITAIVLRVVMFFIGYQTLPRIAMVILLNAIINTPGSSMDVAHRSLLSDSVDSVEAKTGVRTEGVTYSMQNFVSKLQSGISKLVEGELLSILGYDSVKKEKGLRQSEKFYRWQWPMYSLSPIIGSIFYLAFILFVNDNKERKALVEAQLFERREATKAKENNEVNSYVGKSE